MLAAVATLSGCFTRNVEGTYKAVDGIIPKLEFKNGYCTFPWIFTQVTAKYEVKDDHIYVNTTTEFGTIVFNIINDNTIEGTGWLTGTYTKIK